MLFEANQKILFIGDSITDAERRSAYPPLGNGYVSQIHTLLSARYPELHLQVINRGIGGDRTPDLLARWGRDVIDEQPDWLALKIGVNDIWRHFDNPQLAVSQTDYEANMRTLLNITQEQTKARLILLTPYIIEPDPQQSMRAMMDRYGEVVKALAHEYATVLVDTQAAYNDALQHSTPETWSEDRIHPNGPGHAVLALAVLRAVGFTI